MIDFGSIGFDLLYMNNSAVQILSFLLRYCFQLCSEIRNERIKLVIMHIFMNMQHSSLSLNKIHFYYRWLQDLHSKRPSLPRRG